MHARDDITTQDILKQVDEIKQFQKYMQIKITEPNLTKDFQYKNINYLLNDFEQDVLLIFGFEHIDDPRFIQNGYKDWKTSGIFVNYIKLGDKRYKFYGFKNNNGHTNKLLYATDVRMSDFDEEKKKYSKTT